MTTTIEQTKTTTDATVLEQQGLSFVVAQVKDHQAQIDALVKDIKTNKKLDYALVAAVVIAALAAALILVVAAVFFNNATAARYIAAAPVVAVTVLAWLSKLPGNTPQPAAVVPGTPLVATPAAPTVVMPAQVDHNALAAALVPMVQGYIAEAVKEYVPATDTAKIEAIAQQMRPMMEDLAVATQQAHGLHQLAQATVEGLKGLNLVSLTLPQAAARVEAPAPRPQAPAPEPAAIVSEPVVSETDVAAQVTR